MLPEGIRSMLMPDRRQEAELLLFCLVSDLYPTVSVPCVDGNEKEHGTSEVEMPQVFCTCEMKQQSTLALNEY